VSLPYSPAGHGWQAALPLPAVFWPAPQVSQTVASGASVNVFCGQTAHSGWPSWWLARPGMHGRQDAELLSGWWKPSGQAVHRSAFWSSEKRPAAHATQVWSVSFRRLPALHSEHDALPLPALRPVGQGTQTVAWGSAENVLRPHSTQASWPVRSVKVPGMHGRQYGFPKSF